MSTILAKPQMRNLYAKKIKFHLAGAILTSITGGLLFKFLYIERKKARHIKFYETYDSEKQEQIMVDAGLLQSVPKP